MSKILNKALIFTGTSIKCFSILVVYCIPCLVAICFTIYSNYVRSLDVVAPIKAYVDHVGEGKDKDIPGDLIENNVVLERLLNFLKLQNNIDNLKYSPQQIKNKVIQNRIFSEYIFVVALSLLPFVVLGGGIAFKKRKQESYKDMLKLAWKGTLIKFIVAFVIALGWVYVFNPFGQGATAVYEFVLSEDIISTDTLPFYIDYKAQMKHTVAGFLGWYLHLLGYFFFRAFKGDVSSMNLYRKLFVKFLFVFGIALVISAVATKEALIILFFIGFFPLSGISILKEFSLKSFSGDVEKKVSLSIIPGISRWQIIRLDEEEIDSVSTLASTNPETLKEVIPESTIKHKKLGDWIEMAKLISVLGPVKYDLVKEFSLTAKHFIKMSGDDTFKEKVKNKCNIDNTEEIAELLKTELESRAV